MKKYNQFTGIKLENRQWPNGMITQAPMWCSVDLRDGNQALAVPMNVAQKIEMFEILVGAGSRRLRLASQPLLLRNSNSYVA